MQRTEETTSVFKLTIHDKAAAEFNKIATDLRSASKPGLLPTVRRTDEWQPDLYTTTISADQIIGPISITTSGSSPLVFTGDITNGRLLDGDSVKKLSSLTESIWRAIQPRGVVSLEAVTKVVRTWVLSTQDSSSVSDYCTRELAKLVMPMSVWVPIAHLHVEIPFKIGVVEFRQITAEVIDGWFRVASTLSEVDRARAELYRQQTVKDVMGLAAGTLSVTCEKGAAHELAMDKVGDAISVLRIYSPGAADARHVSHLALKGQENAAQYQVFFESKEGTAENRGLVRRPSPPWTIRRRELADLTILGVNKLGAMLENKSLSDFDTKLLTAVRVYSESMIDSRLTTRLILLLAAFEGLLLKDANEPISQNLGERLAIICKNLPDERLQVVRLVRAIYSLRSRFVHHSEHLEITLELEQFFDLCWDAMMRLVACANRVPTAKSLIDHLDYLRMSGGTFSTDSVNAATQTRAGS